MISQWSTALAPEAALVDSIIGSRRGFVHALGALAERDEFLLCMPIRARLRALWWHLPQCLWRPVLALYGVCGARYYPLQSEAA